MEPFSCMRTKNEVISFLEKLVQSGFDLKSSFVSLLYLLFDLGGGFPCHASCACVLLPASKVCVSPVFVVLTWFFSSYALLHVRAYSCPRARSCHTVCVL